MHRMRRRLLRGLRRGLPRAGKAQRTHAPQARGSSCAAACVLRASITERRCGGGRCASARGAVPAAEPRSSGGSVGVRARVVDVVAVERTEEPRGDAVNDTGHGRAGRSDRWCGASDGCPAGSVGGSAGADSATAVLLLSAVVRVGAVAVGVHLCSRRVGSPRHCPHPCAERFGRALLCRVAGGGSPRATNDCRRGPAETQSPALLSEPLPRQHRLLLCPAPRLLARAALFGVRERGCGRGVRGVRGAVLLLRGRRRLLRAHASAREDAGTHARTAQSQPSGAAHCRDLPLIAAFATIICCPGVPDPRDDEGRCDRRRPLPPADGVERSAGERPAGCHLCTGGLACSRGDCVR